MIIGASLAIYSALFTIFRMRYLQYLECRVEVHSVPEPAEHHAKHRHHHRVHGRSTAVCVRCGQWSGWLEADRGRLCPVWDLPVPALCPTQLAGNLLQVCVCVCECMCVNVCVVYVHVCASVCVCVFLCVCMCVCVCVCMFVCACVCVCLCVCVRA